LIFVLGIYIFLINKTIKNNFEKKKNIKEDQYFLNEDFQYNNDPQVTLNPSLEDMLKGPIITNQDPQTGDEKAFVSIVEFSDFQCEYCHKQEQTLKRVLEKYRDKVKLVWKDYPIKDMNSESYQGAIAGRCAQEQNMFWPYHDLLFDAEKLNKENFLNIANALKMDIGKFEKCLVNDAPRNMINANIEEADALQITGVPFIYVNDKEIMGEIDETELESIINYELKITN